MWRGHHSQMMTQQIGFSVLSAPLAAIDRRALSQAWYSALHLAKDRAHSASVPPRVPVLATDASKRRTAVEERKQSETRPTETRAIKREHERTVCRPPLERRTARTALGRKIERCFVNPGQPVQRATFTIDGTQARVHVTLQNRGGDLRIVAICPAAIREQVARALEEARYALAERGVVLRVEHHER